MSVLVVSIDNNGHIFGRVYFISFEKCPKIDLIDFSLTIFGNKEKSQNS